MRILSVVLVGGSLLFSASCKSKKTKPEPNPEAIPEPPPMVLSSAKSFRFTEPVQADTAVSEVPVSLTASDGTGLALVGLDARGIVEEPLAFTELRMTFENPRDQVVEGQFRITLPPGAAVSRFAMKIGRRWQEGEVVEKMAARRAYEDFLHRRQDPALLEQAGGNEFQARVFPIPARGRKELIVSYSHELESASDAYRIPLRGLPAIEKADIRVRIGRDGASAKIVQENHTGWVPTRDVVVASAASNRRGLRAEGVGVVRVRPTIAGEPDEIESLLILVDTSASRALGYPGQLRKVKGLVSALVAGAGDKTPVAIAAFDQSAELIYEGTAGGYGDGEHRKLADRRALGASDLEKALQWASGRSASYARMVVITDGVATAGGTTADELRTAAKALGKSGVRRLDAVAIGGIRDEPLLRALVTAGLAGDGAVIDGDQSLDRVADRLTRGVQSNIRVDIPGASWVWPKKLDALQAGDEALVYFGLEGDKPLEVQVGDTRYTPKLASLADAPRPLLHRAAAQARIAAMLAERDALSVDDKAGRAALKERVIGLSTRHRVLSPFTALLVLETEADYERFKIDRKSLADILAIEPTGLVVVDRTTTTLPPKPTTNRPNPVATDEVPADGIGEPQEDGEREEDSGGTGTKMALEEGKMGTKESTRASGQYAMRNPNAGPQPAREQALENARRAGILGAAARESADGTGAAHGEPIDDLLPDRRAKKKAPPPDPYTGKMAEVMSLLAKQPAKALAKAWAWRGEEPGDVMALIALGECLEKTGDQRGAARAYGSIIDLFSARADLRRFAGQRLERLELTEAAELAVNTFRHAVEQRPDHPSSHRLLAFALVRADRPADAFAALEAGVGRDYPSGRFAGAKRILGEDLGLVAEVWIKADRDKRAEILARLSKAGGTRENKPSLRFVLSWETDANDVDFHIYDGQNNHAFYSQMHLASGGDLYADVTTGYGPECFTIRGKPKAFPYKLQAHYYSRGPMGYGMGKVEIVSHDGVGNLTFEQRPFVIMRDSAFVDLGVVGK